MPSSIPICSAQSPSVSAGVRPVSSATRLDWDMTAGSSSVARRLARAKAASPSDVEWMAAPFHGESSAGTKAPRSAASSKRARTCSRLASRSSRALESRRTRLFGAFWRAVRTARRSSSVKTDSSHRGSTSCREAMYSASSPRALTRLERSSRTSVSSVSPARSRMPVRRR